jgi:hypothetical protein
MLYLVSLSFTFYSPMLSGCSEFPNYHFLIQFLISKDVGEMIQYSLTFSCFAM